ncbi:BlaI/MecI/CopY family transcriptional regulator [Akkermansiaceae bacterium]|jgi:predicted HTH transcriptional regulator|nr:BlaI/MecI/CopY family transcriptional regulator [bacterium]MDB4646089.1 BlaI/MecI/CopY family transcriptional regulator [Akkermansiaceae bacterium]MDC0567310.1 BlaI/MecI/CopY family transcriptional regulator [Akkermansiaceae bacterium]
MLHRQTKAQGKRVDALHQTLNLLSQAERDLLEIVETSGRVTVAQAVEHIGQSRNTLRKRLAGLVAKGLLTLEGKGRGSAYRKR